ncbi:MAG: hypothetical protein NC489_19040 [Ruminococcus flavefaciens]|nr:hypothetical protein [Ruminococcus flavefaciens]
MNIQTNATDRKALAQSLGEHLGVEITYNGPPSFSYQIGDLLVERNGSISGPDAQVESIRSHLEENGWLDREVEQLTTAVPIEGMNGTQLRNLIYALHSKQYLLNRVLRREVFQVSDKLLEAIGTAECEDASSLLTAIGGIENAMTGLALDEANATFSYPTTENGEKDKAMQELVERMVDAAKTASRVNPTELKPENEKYYLRIWLLRLGFTGAEGKGARHALLDGLNGHTAFRTKEEAERFSVAQKAKRAAKKAAADPDADVAPEPSNTTTQEEVDGE